MSLISMESWMAFPRFIGDDTNNATTNAARLAMAKSMAAAGYEYQQANNTVAWLTRPHPLFPDRAAIVYSAASNNNSLQSAFRKKLGNGTGVIIGGFSLFVPGSFKPDATGNAVYPFLTIAAQADGATMINIYANAQLGIGEIFRVRYDLSIAYGPSDVQSSKRITPGKLAYIEYRLTANEIRVWLDDTLVLQKSVAVNHSNIMFSALNWTGSTSPMSGADGQWAISDWYNLKEDAVTPNSRLGPSTRVIGTKPESDNFVQFARPTAYASNASVAALPLNPDAPDYLKTDTVGVQDIYNPVLSDALAGASIVHAMGVKTFAQNVESAPHTLAPMLVSNGTAQGAALPLPSTVGVLAMYSVTDPNTGAPWTPSAATAAKFGVKLET